jgi:hypothetical protein
VIDLRRDSCYGLVMNSKRDLEREIATNLRCVQDRLKGIRVEEKGFSCYFGEKR